jgi:hypothetical protein
MRVVALYVWLVASVGLGVQPAGTPPNALTRPSSQEQIPTGMTEIDGSKTPELIPDHVVWRDTLNFLAEIRRRGEEADIVDLIPLGKADFDVVHKEAGRQRERDESCQTRYRARETELAQARAASDAVAAALDDVLIECRTQNLEAGDRVMDGLSAEGRQILGTYLERRRRSTSALVPQRELKNFRLPR